MKLQFIPQTDEWLQWMHEFMHFHAPDYKSIDLPHEPNDLKHPAICYYVAVEDEDFASAKGLNKDKILGIVSYKPLSNWLARTQKTIVHTHHRGKGYGSKFPCLLEEVIKKHGFGKITCSIYTHNVKMLRIKLTQGHIIEGVHMDHTAKDLHEYTLGKIL